MLITEKGSLEAEQHHRSERAKQKSEVCGNLRHGEILPPVTQGSDEVFCLCEFHTLQFCHRK